MLQSVGEKFRIKIKRFVLIYEKLLEVNWTRRHNRRFDVQMAAKNLADR